MGNAKEAPVGKLETQGVARALALVLWVAALWGVQYARRDFWEPDEARYVYVAREMRSTGNWLVPHRNGEPYAHKPPLMFWLINAGEAVSGPQWARLGARLPSFLGVWLALYAVYGLGELWRGAATGRRAVAVLSTSWLFWQVGGMGQIDALLTGLELTAAHLLVRHDADRRAWRPWGAFLTMGLAVLAKGPVGFVVPLGIYGAITLAGRARSSLGGWQWAGGVALALAVPVLWVVACWLQGAPDAYLRELLFTQNVSRAAGALGHKQSPLYFVWHAPLDFLPWTLFVPVTFATLSRTDLHVRRKVEGWFLLVIALFSLSVSKRHLYILSAYPALSLGVAAAWEEIEGSRPCRRIATALLWLVVVGALSATSVFAFPSVAMRLALRPEHLRWVRETPAWPFALLALPAGLALWRIARSDGRNWLTAHALALAATFAVTGGFVLPELNAAKTPEAIRDVARRHIPADGRLLLCGMNGEILALYAGRRGERVEAGNALGQAMRREVRGVAVFPTKEADRWFPGVCGVTATGEFPMGSKHFTWVAYDLGAGDLKKRNQ